MAENNKDLVNDSAFAELEESLLSMERLEQSSPELWPEKIPGITEFINTYKPSTNNVPPYSKEFTTEDNNYMHQLAALSTNDIILKVKELHDNAYKLGIEESKEMTRGKFLNIFRT